MRQTTEPTRRAQIYIAGDLATARQVCREFCMEGLCVTVTPTTFVYTGGAEEGVEIGLVNYPRFPSSQARLYQQAKRLGRDLMERLCQHSYLVVTPKTTTWHSRRSED